MSSKAHYVILGNNASPSKVATGQYQDVSEDVFLDPLLFDKGPATSKVKMDKDKDKGDNTKGMGAGSKATIADSNIVRGADFATGIKIVDLLTTTDLGL